MHLRRQMNAKERLDTKRFRQDTIPLVAGFCAAPLSCQEAEITDNVLGPSGFANTDGNVGGPSDLANIESTKLALHH
jgi:hypothetical protein